jgi:hypothetical protein
MSDGGLDGKLPDLALTLTRSRDMGSDNLANDADDGPHGNANHPIEGGGQISYDVHIQMVFFFIGVMIGGIFGNVAGAMMCCWLWDNRHQIREWRSGMVRFFKQNVEAWHPLPGAPLRFRLRFVATLRLRLGAGSGLPSAALFDIF